MHTIQTKRAYDPVATTDGFRVLVDRVWPRGVSKEELHVKIWAKDVAPSTSLRKWFGHDPRRWAEFKTRYKQELRDPDVRAHLHEILEQAGKSQTITLVFGAKDREHNQAIVLEEALRQMDSRT
ncbi:MAG: DUF488 family protein [Candidatus Eremiobacteraeota bacterium]|nr:DUF488 family protein [Candidatus Eremiobacteraeota bacterium]